MTFVIFPLAALGFVFGLSAFSEIKSLKSKVKELEQEINDMKS